MEKGMGNLKIIIMGLNIWNILSSWHVASSMQQVSKPLIYSTSDGHAIVGETFELACEVRISHNERHNIEWVSPPGLDASRVIKKKPKFHNLSYGDNIIRVILTIKNTQKSDSGLYKCMVTDHLSNRKQTKYLMTILEPNEGYLNISEPKIYYFLKQRVIENVTLMVNCRCYPRPTIAWYKPDGTEIHKSIKYELNSDNSMTSLIIKNAQMNDTGEYVLRATNGNIEKELKFNVSVSDAPKVFVEDVYVRAGEEAHLTCRVLSDSTAEVSWTFVPCGIVPKWPTCERKFEQNFNSSSTARPGKLSIEYIHELNFTPEKPGIIHCLASNSKGLGKGSADVLIADIKANMTIYGIDENAKIARGDEVNITCAASAYHFSNDIQWYKNGQAIQKNSDIEVNNVYSNYSHKKTLKFKRIRDDDEARYECRAKVSNYQDKMESKIINIFVHEPIAPEWSIKNINPNAKMQLKIGDSLNLECKTNAVPLASVSWYKDDAPIQASERISLLEENTKLIIPAMKLKDDGIYKCVATNRLGTIETTARVKINKPGLWAGWIWCIIVFLLILVILACVFIAILNLLYLANPSMLGS